MLVGILIGSALILMVAYRLYGGLLVKLFQLDDKALTPAMELRDDNDYLPVKTSMLLPQHFSAIAAAGPIVGPILAGMMFGWAPALIWILVGSVFIGGVHDFAALVASVRHKAMSISMNSPISSPKAPMSSPCAAMKLSSDPATRRVMHSTR